MKLEILNPMLVCCRGTLTGIAIKIELKKLTDLELLNPNGGVLSGYVQGVRSGCQSGGTVREFFVYHQYTNQGGGGGGVLSGPLTLPAHFFCFREYGLSHDFLF